MTNIGPNPAWDAIEEGLYEDEDLVEDPEERKTDDSTD